MTAFPHGMGNVIQRRAPYEGAGTNPRPGAERRRAVVGHELHVGRGSRDAFDSASGSGHGRIGRLHDRDSRVPRSGHEMHEAQRIFRKDQAVRVEYDDEVSVRYPKRCPSVLGLYEQDTVRRCDFPEASSHERDVAVQIHRLVGLVGEVHVPPALEARDLGPEQRCQATILRQEIYRRGLRQQLEGVRTV